jgi:hypothetical protein
LAAYILCPKECSLQGISQIVFHTTTGWISSCCFRITNIKRFFSSVL